MKTSANVWKWVQLERRGQVFILDELDVTRAAHAASKIVYHNDDGTSDFFVLGHVELAYEAGCLVCETLTVDDQEWPMDAKWRKEAEMVISDRRVIP